MRLALTSECDDGVDTLGAVDGAVYYTLKWTPECAAAAIDTSDAGTAGSLFPSERDFFIVNSATAGEVTVRVRNPNVAETPWTALEGAITFTLEMRRADEQSAWQRLDEPAGGWPSAQFCANDVIDGPSCYAECADPDADEKCCKGLSASCAVDADCCTGAGLTCRNNVCSWPADDSTAEIVVDTTQFDDLEG